MKTLKFLFITSIVLLQACGKTGTQHEGLLVDIDITGGTESGRNNGLYYDGVKIADIPAVFLQSGKSDPPLSPVVNYHYFNFSIDGSKEWDLDYDTSIKNKNRVGYINLLESGEGKNQDISIFSREINEVKYEGASARTTDDFRFYKEQSFNMNSFTMKQFIFYRNPNDFFDASLKAFIDCTTESGTHIEIIYRGKCTVL